MKPLCIDLFCGLGGFSAGFLAEGFACIGFDIERHDYGAGGYPGQLVIQDVLTIHGSQFRDVAVIVASPPCQEFSYMAMPWSRAKAKAAEYRNGTRDVADLTRLFDACFRIQREACEAAGRYIPLVVENVKGAQPWVGPAKWHYGSFYLWVDVPALMPSARHLKVPGMNFHEHEKTGQPGRSFQSAAVKQAVAGAGETYGGDFGWDGSAMRTGNSKSPARKAASAQIAMIPFELSRWIARTYKPVERVA
ncbi:MAG: DNA cytosine methyltransferase [Bryobacteraceae bacterium]